MEAMQAMQDTPLPAGREGSGVGRYMPGRSGVSRYMPERSGVSRYMPEKPGVVQTIDHFRGCTGINTDHRILSDSARYRS